LHVARELLGRVMRDFVIHAALRDSTP
jgi:hypothetical protein